MSEAIHAINIGDRGYCGATGRSTHYWADTTCPECLRYAPLRLSEHSRLDLETPGETSVDPSATEGLEGPQIFDVVQKPLHYNSHPSGVECIQITEHMGYCLGNAIKYIWRADLKGKPVQDLKKAIFYIEREIAKREST